MKKFIYTGIIALGISILLAGNCMAGDMNGEESRVYAAACGTFSYNGESYQATSSYLAKLSAYLCRDDINLTASQADASIRTMNRTSNIKKAIDSGYLVAASQTDTEAGTEDGGTSTESGTTPSTENDTESSDNSENTSTEKSTDKSGIDSQSGTDKNKQDSAEGTETKADADKSFLEEGNSESNKGSQSTEQYTEKGASAEETTDISSDNQSSTFDSSAEAEEAAYENKENQKERETILKTRPQKETADAGVVTYDEENNEIVFSGSHNQTIVLPSSFQKIKGTHTRNLFIIAEAVLMILTLASGAVLFIFHCYSFQNKSHKNHYGNHKARRGLRKILGSVVVIVMAVNIFVILMGAGIQIGLFQNARVTDTLSASGYYHESYNDLMSEIHDKMTAACCPENACDDVITYDNYLFATRNHVQMALIGKSASAEYADISSEVADALDGVAYLTDDSRQKIGEDVLELYQQYVGNIIGESIYGIKQIFDNIVGINMILAVIDSLLSILILLFMDHYKHRGMKKIAAAMGIASMVLLVTGIVIMIGKPYTKLYIEPDYLYLFVAAYIRFMTKVLICLSVGGAVVAVVIQFAGNSMKKRLRDN